MDADLLRKVIDDLAAGRWAVGVSGGADSVALLLLLKSRSDLFLHVAHLDHETRSGQSGLDADFVRELADKLNLPCTIEKRSAIEAVMPKLVKNPSSRYRQARFALFRKVVDAEDLQGVVLAHHADDQAETVLMRILQGSAASNLAGMKSRSIVAGLQIARPLLQISGQKLRTFLQQSRQTWREDASNKSSDYQRNRLRLWLANHPAVRDNLLKLENASDAVRHWLEMNSPKLEQSFRVEVLCDVPNPLACYAAACWLVDRGAPPRQISTQCCQRLIQMCTDAAASPRQHFPGGILVRRKGGKVFVE